MTSSLIHRPPETIIWTPQLPPPEVRNDNCGGVVERMMYWQLLYSKNNYFSETTSLSSSFSARKTTSFRSEVNPRVHSRVLNVRLSVKLCSSQCKGYLIIVSQYSCMYIWPYFTVGGFENFIFLSKNDIFRL